MTERQDPEERPRRKRRAGVVVAIVGATMLFLGTVGAVADMIIQSTTKVRDQQHGGGALHVQARNFAYVPTSMLIRGKLEATIALTNDGVSQHSFTIDDPAVDVVVQPGETRYVTVRVTHPEGLVFYCRFHQNYGMRGFLAFVK